MLTCYGVRPCYGVSPCYGDSPCYGVSLFCGANLCYGVRTCYGVSPCYGISPQNGVSSCYVTFGWVTRPERLKGAKDEVMKPEGPPARSQAPEGPLDFGHNDKILFSLM